MFFLCRRRYDDETHLITDMTDTDVEISKALVGIVSMDKVLMRHIRAFQRDWMQALRSYGFAHHAEDMPPKVECFISKCGTSRRRGPEAARNARLLAAFLQSGKGRKRAEIVEAGASSVSADGGADILICTGGVYSEEVVLEESDCLIESPLPGDQAQADTAETTATTRRLVPPASAGRQEAGDGIKRYSNFASFVAAESVGQGCDWVSDSAPIPCPLPVMSAGATPVAQKQTDDKYHAPSRSFVSLPPPGNRRGGAREVDVAQARCAAAFDAMRKARPRVPRLQHGAVGSSKRGGRHAQWNERALARATRARAQGKGLRGDLLCVGDCVGWRVRGDGDVCSKVAAGLPRGRGRSPRLVPAKKAGADLHPVEMQGEIVRLFGGARALCLVRCHADMHREGKGGAVTSVAGVQEHRGHRQPQKNAGKASLASPHRQSADSQRNRRKGEVGKLEACNAPGPAFQHCKLVSGGLTGETDLSHKHASGRVLLIRTAALFSVARAPRADGKGRVGGGRAGAGAGGLAGKAISRPYRDENKEGMRGRPEGGFFLSRALRAEASKRGKVQTCAPTTPALAQETLARKRKKMQGQEAGRRELLTQVHLSPHSASSQAEASEQSERSTPDNVLVIPHFRFVFMCVEVSRIV